MMTFAHTQLDSHKSEGSDADERSGTAAAAGAGEPDPSPQDVIVLLQESRAVCWNSASGLLTGTLHVL